MREFYTAIPQEKSKKNYKCSFCNKTFVTANERNKCEDGHESELQKKVKLQEELNEKYKNLKNSFDKHKKQEKEFIDFISRAEITLDMISDIDFFWE